MGLMPRKPESASLNSTRRGTHMLLAVGATLFVSSRAASASALLHGHAVSSLGRGVPSGVPHRLSNDTIRQIVLGLAGASAQVGGIVVVFIAFTFDRVLRLRGNFHHISTEYRALREKTRLQMLMVVAGISMAILLLAPVYLVFELLANQVDLQLLGIVGLATFSYSVTAILVALFSYTYLERPFTYATEPQP
jgi:hypothetical protein